MLTNPLKRREYDQNGRLDGQAVVGNYIIKELLAEGGFGPTYLGMHRISRMPVCIKHCHEVSAASKQILLDEARTIWDLRHYALPVMRDILEMEDGSLAIVMSFIPGPTIEQVVERVRGRLDPENVCWITQRIINALQYLHYHGVVHGDIKPQNLIVQEETHSVCLVDFGLAMVKPTSKDRAKGYTPIFASPEQIAGQTLLPESDFYSLGMTILFMLTGSLEHTEKLMIPNDVPDPLCEFIKRLLRRDVLSRPRWDSEDLNETLQKVRMASFGRTHSDMKRLMHPKNKSTNTK